jgi:CheY-like chemotaxis protein
MVRRVLFLPGASGAAQFWKPVADRLPGGWEKILFDWPGCGAVAADPRVRSFDDLVDLVPPAYSCQCHQVLPTNADRRAFLLASDTRQTAQAASDTSAAVMELSMLADPKSGSRARIAVIDDDADITALVQELLSEEGFEVAVWDRVQEPSAFLDGRQVDLVLLDLGLGASAECGWGVLSHLARNPSTRRLPVILWSASCDALRAHADSLLVEHDVYLLEKPFRIDTLLDMISAALTEARLSPSLTTDSPSSIGHIRALEPT